ncbi:SUKH-4 family immunity protein [Streptomyces sp. SCSIO 75703]|uniref:SUKH-4 family immunity protein n=1 Tax=Streptomyces sp. SCSIO 75703 TaxID=3112165 RepID=UPI0030D41AEF
MVTFAQAQERAEEWINGELPAYQHREVRVREFDLGFVVWAEDRADGPRSDGGAQRLVIARDSGEATLWPGLPVGEVIRRYEEEYGRPEGAGQEPAPAPAARVDLNQTSFLLSPPEWLQEAADKLGIPDRRGGDQERRDEAGATPAGGFTAASGPTTSATTSGPGTGPAPDAGTGPDGGARWPAAAGTGGAGAPAQTLAGPPAAPGSGADPAGAPRDSGTGWPAAGGEEGAAAPGAPGTPGSTVVPGAPVAPGVPAGGAPEAPFAPAAPVPSEPTGSASGTTPWAGTDTTADAGEDRSVPLPETVVAPPLSNPDAGSEPSVTPDAKTALMSGGSGLPATAVAPALPTPDGPPAPVTPPSGTATPPPPAPDAGDIADAATSKATPPPRRGDGPATPPPPPPPGAPGGSQGGSAGGYVPTQLVSSIGGPGGVGGAAGPSTPPPPSPPAAPDGTPPPAGPPGGTTPPGGVHHAATMLADPGRTGGGTPPPPAPPGAPGAAPGGPGTPPPPSAPGAHGSAGGAHGAVHHAQTVLAAPSVSGPPQPPGPPGAPGGYGAPGAVPPPPPGATPPGQPRAYGYPQPPAGLPTVGPGYQAVLRYRAQDGSEQQLIRRSAPGTPHPEWQIFHELRAMNVPPDQVLELHTELESCELPGAYCARMIREQWPQARITSIAPYGTDHASRQQGMQQLLAHQGELHQVADGPARPAPVRAPLPPVPPAPPVPPEAVGQELAGAFGPGVFRFEHAAVSRQGVPPVVAHTLVAAGLPLDMGPFFWAQAQPGRPVPTLAELAAERSVQPSSDAGSYLVVGSDFGRAICVQYGTANIVAVPVEGGPGGAPVPPQFVNTGLPEFARCLALLGRMWRLRFGLNQEQAGRWTVDFQAQLAALDPAALGSPESWWSVLLEQMWDGLL